MRFPRRYDDPRDAEVAAVVAALLAFGRVELFGPVIAATLAQADARGGPYAWVLGFDARDAGALAPLYYRWFDGADLALLARTLGAALRDHPTLGALFPRGPARATLDAGVAALAAYAPTGGSRAFGTWFARPAGGSACKRWAMLLRWMVRRDGADLALWGHLSPADLVIPVDTHILRVARLLGLTARPTADWRTAEEITAALRRVDPEDPVRFDFALAHLGISGACAGRRDEAVCPACPLEPVCLAGRRPTAYRPRSRRPGTRT